MDVVEDLSLSWIASSLLIGGVILYILYVGLFQSNAQLKKLPGSFGMPFLGEAIVTTFPLLLSL